MRVAFFTDTFQPDQNGVVMSMLGFATELKRLGSEVVFVTPQINRRRPHLTSSPDINPEDLGIHVHSLPSIPLVFERSHQFALPLVRRAMRIVEREKIDIIHTHTPFGLGYTGVRVSKALGLPLVHTYHTFFAEYVHYLKELAAVGRRMTPSVSRWLCNMHDLVLAPSSDVQQLLQRYGVRKPVEVFMTGVDVPNESRTAEAELHRATLGVRPDERVLLYVGRLAREKNVDLLLDTADHLRADGRPFQLWLVGDGPARRRLTEIVDQRSLGRHVRFMGWVQHDELGRWFGAADIFTFPSMTETQGLSLLEAMAHAMPSVSVAGPGIRDVLQHGANGLLTSPEPRQFADTIDTLIDDAPLRDKLGTAARRTAEHLDKTSQARRLLDLYSDLRTRCARSARRGLRGLARTAWEEAKAWR